MNAHVIDAFDEIVFAFFKNAKLPCRCNVADHLGSPFGEATHVGWSLFRGRIRIPASNLTGEDKAAILAAMIGQLRGRLADKRPNQVLVDVNGVGYVVLVPLSTYATLGDLHTEVTLLIHTHVREDALALYGFLSSREKHFFEMLLSASGVGSSLGLTILSGMSVEELVPAIRNSDLARLTKIPGVGRKTAERMVVELKDKLEAVTVEVERPGAP